MRSMPADYYLGSAQHRAASLGRIAESLARESRRVRDELTAMVAVNMRLGPNAYVFPRDGEKLAEDLYTARACADTVEA